MYEHALDGEKEMRKKVKLKGKVFYVDDRKLRRAKKARQSSVLLRWKSSGNS